MTLSLAIAQIQLRPQYHPSYSIEPKGESGRPISKLRIARKQQLYEISVRLGEAAHADILAEIRKTDSRIGKDDVRKMLNELITDKRMGKRTVYGGGKKVFYKASPE